MIECLKDLIVGFISLLKGLVVTLKNLLSHAITLQYPTQKMPMTERFRGLADLHVERCIKCYQCVKICPTGCLSITHRETEDKKKELVTFKYNMELCCFCGLCEQVCPTDAIYMSKIYEIATYDHEKLYIDLLNPEKYVEWLNPNVK